MTATSIAKFHDAAERPPSGGWHYFYNPSDGSSMFGGHSAEAIIDELTRYRTNNGTFTTRSAIEAEVWRYWCSRHPERCGAMPTTAATPFLPLDQRPGFFGPIIWRHLNLAATRFDTIGREQFLAIVATITGLMGCVTCQQSLAKILADNPPTAITTTKDACQWVNLVHNLVNQETGKAQYAYERMVTEYGAPLP